jgi:hypothetical protein
MELKKKPMEFNENSKDYHSVEEILLKIEQKYHDPIYQRAAYLVKLDEIRSVEKEKKSAFLALIPDTLKKILENWPQSDTEQDEDSGEEFEDAIRFRGNRLRSILRQIGKPKSEIDKMYILKAITFTAESADAYEQWLAARLFGDKFEKDGKKFDIDIPLVIDEKPQINIYPGIIEEMKKTNRLLETWQESLNLQSLSHSIIKIRLKYDDLRFISAWKAADKETADMSFKNFCNKYLTSKGHSIDPKQLEDAWEGRNQFEQVESGKKLYERMKKRWDEENVRNMLESEPLFMRNRDKAFAIICDVKINAPKMKRSEIVKEIMHRLPTNYYSANRYMNAFEKQSESK